MNPVSFQGTVTEAVLWPFCSVAPPIDTSLKASCWQAPAEFGGYLLQVLSASSESDGSVTAGFWS